MGKVRKKLKDIAVNRHCNLHFQLKRRIVLLRKENDELKKSNCEVMKKMNEVKMNQANSSEETHSLLTSNLSLLMEHNHSLEEVSRIREEADLARSDLLTAISLVGKLSAVLLSASKRLEDILISTQENTANGVVTPPMNLQDKRVNRSQPVCPMVRGHLIQKPTVSLKRLTVPYPSCVRPGDIGREMMTLSPIEEEQRPYEGGNVRRRGRLGKRQFRRVNLPGEGTTSVEELMLPVVRLRMLSDSWLTSVIPSQEQNETVSVSSEENGGEIFRGWPDAEGGTSGINSVTTNENLEGQSTTNSPVQEVETDQRNLPTSHEDPSEENSTQSSRLQENTTPQQAGSVPQTPSTNKSSSTDTKIQQNAKEDKVEATPSTSRGRTRGNHSVNTPVEERRVTRSRKEKDQKKKTPLSSQTSRKEEIVPPDGGENLEDLPLGVSKRKRKPKVLYDW